MLTDYNELLLPEDIPISNISNLYRPASHIRNYSDLEGNKTLVHNGPSLKARKNKIYKNSEIYTTKKTQEHIIIKSYFSDNNIKYGFEFIENGGYDYHQYLYYDNYKGNIRLNISLHGGFIDNITGDIGVFLNNDGFSYEKVSDIAKKRRQLSQV